MNEYASNQFQGDLSPKRIAELLNLVQEKLEGAQKCSP